MVKTLKPGEEKTIEYFMIFLSPQTDKKVKQIESWLVG